MTLRKTLLSTCACLAFAAPGLAQTNPQQDDVIVVTGQLSNFGATKSSAPILETARSVSVVTTEDFLARGALTLDDALNYTSGVVGDTFGFSTRGDFFQVRGLDVPEYRDNLQALFGNYNNTRPHLYTVDQVEVLKGPASVLYGQGSPGGIVNLASKRAGPDLEQEVVLSYGTHDRLEIAGDFNATLIEDTLYARFVGVYRDSDTQVDFVTDDAVSIAPSLTWTPNDRTEINLLVNYDERDGDTAHQFLPLTGTLNPSPSGQVIESSTYLGEPGFNRYETESTAVTMIASHRLNEIFTLEGTARWRDSSSEYSQSWIRFTGTGRPRTTGLGIGMRSWYDNPAESEQLAFDTRIRADFNTGSFEHEVLAGVNYQSVELTSSRAFLVQGALNVFDPFNNEGVLTPRDATYGNNVPSMADLDAARGFSETETEFWGFYAHDQISWNNWVANFGIRVDDATIDSVSRAGPAVTTQNQDDNATTIAAGLLYAFDNGVSPYISYAESFNPVLGTDNVTNDPLKSEEGEQFEIGLKYQPAGSRAFVTLAYFDITQSNLPNPASLIGGDIPSQQEGEAEIKGFEIEGTTYLDLGLGELRLDGAASWLDAEDPNGLQFASIPEEQFSVWGEFRPHALEDLRVGLGARYVGNNKSFGISVVDGSLVEIETDGYTVADMMIGYEFDNWSAMLNVRNLFDENYYATCLARGDCFPGEERTVNVRLARRF